MIILVVPLSKRWLNLFSIICHDFWQYLWLSCVKHQSLITSLSEAKMIDYRLLNTSLYRAKVLTPVYLLCYFYSFCWL